MTGDLFFSPFDPATQEGDPDPQDCGCKADTGLWTLAVEGGDTVLVHRNCKLSLGEWALDCVSLDSLPVSLVRTPWEDGQPGFFSLDLTPITGEAPTEEVCQCGSTDGTWLLSMEYDYTLVLVHKACNQPPDVEAWQDYVVFETTVRIEIETCSDPGGWHGYNRCDCGVTVHLIPQPETEQP